jgi:hypothetical protein
MNRALAAGAALCGLFAATVSHAVPINHGNFVGSTVTYLQVTEDVASPGDSTPLFGAPTISGDSLDFDPISFTAAATGAGGVDTTAANVEFDIQAKTGNFIQTVFLTEAGNTTLAGFGTNSTFTSVTGNIEIDIEQVDGAPVPGGSINYTTLMTFTPSGGTYQLGADGGGGPVFNSSWSGIALIDIEDILDNLSIPYTGGATLVTVSLTNTLVALSENGTQALITKQDADGVTITVNVPEPTTLAMGIAVIAGLAGLRRR